MIFDILWVWQVNPNLLDRIVVWVKLMLHFVTDTKTPSPQKAYLFEWVFVSPVFKVAVTLRKWLILHWVNLGNHLLLNEWRDNSALLSFYSLFSTINFEWFGDSSKRGLHSLQDFISVFLFITLEMIRDSVLMKISSSFRAFKILLFYDRHELSTMTLLLTSQLWALWSMTECTFLSELAY